MKVKAIFFRTLVFAHRYMGIGIGWLMLLWCLSGIVMMYVRYPELQRAETYASRAPLEMTRCCAVPAQLYAADERIIAASIVMLSGRPVLQVLPNYGFASFVDLHSGQQIAAVTGADALSSARQYLHAMRLQGMPQLLSVIDHDQWTVYGRYDPDRPLYHVALNDAAGTELYFSQASGGLVQKTTRSERFWNWLGSVPHWLYFEVLRQNTGLWAQIMIWSSVLGCFLSVFGLYMGIWQLRRKRDGRLHSPYRGWKYWHHVPGLLFGMMVLTWVFSGLLSMNPWGWLELPDAAFDARQLRGELPVWAEVHEAITILPTASLPQDTASLEASILQGRLSWRATTQQGTSQRLNTRWQAAPLSDTEITQAVTALDATASWSRLNSGDTYYYSHGRDHAVLPAVRVMTQDAQATRYYLDAVSGELLRKVDDNARWYRWLHSGLHRLDFSPVFRMRPLWDGMMWLLLLGASLICATGVWLGIRRLRGRFLKSTNTSRRPIGSAPVQ